MSIVTQPRRFLPVIMAGGMGKRMKSDLPKVLHNFHGEPMLVKIIKTTLELEPSHVLVVVGKFRNTISQVLHSHLTLQEMSLVILIDQLDPQGTGHAVQCAVPAMAAAICDIDTRIVVLSGDVPLISADIIRDMKDAEGHSALAITRLSDPTGYGRIITDATGHLSKIVEQKDCNEEEGTVTTVNCGLYMFSFVILEKYLPLLKNNNAQNEFYLTDLFHMFINDKLTVSVVDVPPEKQHELQGVNTPEQLRELESLGQLNA